MDHIALHLITHSATAEHSMCQPYGTHGGGRSFILYEHTLLPPSPSFSSSPCILTIPPCCHTCFFKIWLLLIPFYCLYLPRFVPWLPSSTEGLPLLILSMRLFEYAPECGPCINQSYLVSATEVMLEAGWWSGLHRVWTVCVWSLSGLLHTVTCTCHMVQWDLYRQCSSLSLT